MKQEQDHFEKGVIAFNSEDYATALLEFNDVLLLNDKNIWANANIGASLHKIGQNNDALPIILDLLKKMPNYDGSIESAIGVIYADMDDHVNATKFFLMALEYPDYQNDAVLLHDIGLSLKNVGNYTGAKFYFERAIDDGIAYDNIYLEYGNILNIFGFHQDAITPLDIALSQQQDFVLAIISKGISFEFQGLFTPSLAEYEKAINLDETVSDSFKNKIRVQEKIKKYGFENEQNRYVLEILFPIVKNAITALTVTCSSGMILEVDSNQFIYPLELKRSLIVDDHEKTLLIKNHGDEDIILNFYYPCIQMLE